MNQYQYFCTSCQTEIEKFDQSIVIDKDCAQPFCSEKCVRDFFRPQTKHFQRLEKDYRDELGLEENIIFDEEVLGQYVQGTLSSWEEHFHDKDKLGHSFHYLFRKFRIDAQEVFLVLIAKFFGDKPSYLIHYFFTQQNQLLSKFRLGKELKVIKQGDEGFRAIPDEVLSLIDQTKSELFAGLIENISDDDIPLEDYFRYEEYRLKTLKQADEVIKREDDENRIFETYIKAFQDRESPFFYFVICLIVNDQGQQHSIPVFSFPSRKEEVYKKFSEGKAIKKKEYN